MGAQLLTEKNSDADNLSIEIGMNLWRDRGLEVKPNDIQQAILLHLPRYRRTFDQVHDGYY
jgi:hypothetical protein